MMSSLTCPQCSSKAYKRNGYTRHGKQNHRCLDCGRQFSHEPISFTQEKEEKLMIELLSMAASNQSQAENESIQAVVALSAK